MLGRGENKKWSVYSLAQEGKSPNSLSCDDAQLPAAQDALRKGLLSSLAELATSLLPIRETDPFTADVIAASGVCVQGQIGTGSVEQEEARTQAFVDYSVSLALSLPLPFTISKHQWKNVLG